jgi:hypothetical protein
MLGGVREGVKASSSGIADQELLSRARAIVPTQTVHYVNFATDAAGASAWAVSGAVDAKMPVPAPRCSSSRESLDACFWQYAKLRV